MVALEWLDGEMRDGIRKILNKRESKRAGTDVFAFKVPYRNTAGKQTSETFSTVRAAERFRDKVRNMRNEGVMIDVKAGKVSVEVYAAEWLTAAAQKREGTYLRYESYMRMHIVPALGGRQLRAVTRSDIQAFVNDLVGKGLAARTVQGIYKTTAALFRSAHLLDNKITTSPCVGIVLPAIPDREVKLLTVRQVRAFAAGMPGRWQAAVLLAAGTGLRISEILGLTWDRVDLEAGLVKVDRQMAPRRRFGPVKTRRSKRTVPLPARIVGILRQHHQDYPPRPQDIPHTDGSTVHGAELVFTTKTGRAGTLQDIAFMVRIARGVAGLPDTVVFHTLRHTYASLQIAAGTNITALRDRMGHGSITITGDTYGHLYPLEDDRTRDAIDNAFTADDNGSDGTPDLSATA